MSATSRASANSSQDLIARLLATENIFIEHRNVSTAYFDMVGRVLTLPIWKELEDDDAYLMLIGHEVGHALFTPTEQWLAALKENKKIKDILNIVEDARIERKIKELYPGLRGNFNRAYQNILIKKMGDLSPARLSSAPFHDRINLFFKVQFYNGIYQIPFSEEEQKIVDRISTCETFDEVIVLSKEIYSLIKENSENLIQQLEEALQNLKTSSSTEMETPEFPDDYSSPSSFEETEDDGEESEEMPEVPEFQNDEAPGEEISSIPDSDLVSEEEEVEEENDEGINIPMEENPEGEEVPKDENLTPSKKSEKKFTEEVKEEEEDDFVLPPSETVNSLNDAIQEFKDPTISYLYVDIPNIDPEKLITPYQEVHKQISRFYSKKKNQVDVAEEIQKFKVENNPVVSFMFKEFELKKQAKKLVTRTQAKTGIIDTKALHKYKYSDKLFKTKKNLPKGKDHGLIMFIDQSSSMMDSMVGTLDQLFNLVFFCRKINIPFEVYGFKSIGYSATMNSDAGPNDILFSPGTDIRNYFSSKMSLSDFNVALENMFKVREYYKDRYYKKLPPAEQTGGTPLHETIILARQMVQKFKKENNLSIVNTVILSDGDHCSSYHDFATNSNLHGAHSEIPNVVVKVRIRDKKTRKEFLVNNREDGTKVLLEMLSEVTGTKTLGFFIIPVSSDRLDHYTEMTLSHYLKIADPFTNPTVLCERFMENGYMINKNSGYDEQYFIKIKIVGRNQTVKEEVKKTNNDFEKLQSDFIKETTDTVKSRVVLGKFIDQIR